MDDTAIQNMNDTFKSPRPNSSRAGGPLLQFFNADEFDSQLFICLYWMQANLADYVTQI